jgi:hypothetical protein
MYCWRDLDDDGSQKPNDALTNKTHVSKFGIPQRERQLSHLFPENAIQTNRVASSETWGEQANEHDGK